MKPRSACRLRPACVSALLCCALRLGAASLLSLDRVDPWQVSLGGHPAAFAPGPLALAANPALLADSPGLTLAAGAIRTAGLAELDQGWCGLSLPLLPRGQLALALAALTGGDEVWRETGLALGLAGRLFGPVNAGIALRWQTLAVDGMGSAGLVAFDLGCTVTLDTALRLGFAVDAINEPAPGSDPADRLLSECAGSLVWQPSTALFCGASLAVDQYGTAPALFAGCEPVPGISLRAALETAVPAFAVGIGIELGDYRLDYACRFVLNGIMPDHAVALAWRPAAGAGGLFAGHETSRIDLNTAGRHELTALARLTGRLADRLIAERKKRPFCRIEDVVRVKGLSWAFVRRHRGRLAVTADGAAYLAVTNRAGRASAINAWEIRDLAARGIRADTARRIVLLRDSLGGFVRADELALLPNGETNWIARVFAEEPR